jgi:DNA-3-methyladenine glycosylase II
LTPADYVKARRLLLRRDPVLAALIRKHGECGLAQAQRVDHFSALVRAITGQQLSTKAASTIFARLVALMPDGLTPAALSALSDEQMRAVGMSRQKITYFRDLSGKALSGVVPLDALDEMSDEEVIAALTKIKGIGRWSAEMFLTGCSACGRPRDRQCHKECVSVAEATECRPHTQDRRGMAALSVCRLLVPLAQPR